MGAIKEKLRHLAGTDPAPSLALVMPWGPQAPGLQPHLERLHAEVHTTVWQGLQRGQGACRQQREGLEQMGQHHEELHTCQRFSQAHTCPTAKGCHFGVLARLQEAVCEQMGGWGREVFSSCEPRPPSPHLLHFLLHLHAWHLAPHIPGQNSCGRSQTISSRLAPWRLGIMIVSSGMS